MYVTYWKTRYTRWQYGHYKIAALPLVGGAPKGRLRGAPASPGARPAHPAPGTGGREGCVMASNMLQVVRITFDSLSVLDACCRFHLLLFPFLAYLVYE